LQAKFFLMQQKATPVVLNLIIICVIAFIAQNVLTAVDILNWGGLHYFKSDEFLPHQLITSNFLHIGFGHIMFNMFALFLFGSFIENVIGSKRFLFLFMVSAVASSLLEQLTIPYSAEAFVKNAADLKKGAEFANIKAELIHMYKQQYVSAGASGAIMGVMAAFAYLFPNMELQLFLIPVNIKAKYLIPLFVLIDLFGGINPVKNNSIGHFAHIGGAIAGFAVVYYWNKTNRKTFY
jgi:membrane associated rhomboid family serine protease